MSTTFQRFDLVPERLKNPELEGKIHDALFQRVSARLNNIGYVVLASDSHSNGLPHSIIIGGNHDMSIREHFAEVGSALALAYQSGQSYAEKR